jgi:hypothetical protein
MGCIQSCQSSALCKAINHMNSTGFSSLPNNHTLGSVQIGSGACMLLGAGCQEQNHYHLHWHMYFKPNSSAFPQASAQQSSAVSRPVAPSSSTVSSTNGSWEVWEDIGCVNWEAIALGSASLMKNVEDCKSACRKSEPCYAVNYQKKACTSTAEDRAVSVGSGACFLFAKGHSNTGCAQGQNHCWDLLIKSASR